MLTVDASVTSSHGSWTSFSALMHHSINDCSSSSTVYRLSFSASPYMRSMTQPVALYLWPVFKQASGSAFRWMMLYDSPVRRVLFYLAAQSCLNEGSLVG